VSRSYVAGAFAVAGCFEWDRRPEFDCSGEYLRAAPSSWKPAASGAAGEEKRLSRLDGLAAWVGAAILALTLLAFFLMPAKVRGFGGISDDGYYKGFILRLDVILAGVFLASFCLAPALTILAGYLRRYWRDAYTYGALLGVCGFLWVFLVHEGRWQYGAWDFNIMVDAGWRQVQGQHAYVDFVTTNPPGFNLGIQYAFEWFGVSWDANLYFSALFACVTLVWMYWLMVRLSLGRPAAMAVAFAIECAAMLTLCFWWYNNSALILAAVFFLSCLLYAQRSSWVPAQVSYFVSLTLLALMKPNIAGVTVAGGVVLLFLVAERKIRLILVTLAAAAAAVGLLLIHHVSIPAMLASYLSVAKERGGIGARFGYREMTEFEGHSALLWIALVSVPLLGVAPRMVREIRRKDGKGVAYGFFFPLALVVALYGLATNGEYRDVECTILLAAGAVVTFGLRWNGPLLRRVFIGVVCASMAGDLYYGAARVRVYGIEEHLFFEWKDNGSRVASGFLKNMRVSSTMVEVEREVGSALKTYPGPYFFGPRMEFNYAAFGLTSPEHLPLYWQAGTSYGVAEEAHLAGVWQQSRFPTLIFLKAGAVGDDPEDVDDSTYPDAVIGTIDRDYVKDERFPYLTIYRRRGIDDGQP
jgi:hypothetical protein